MTEVILILIDDICGGRVRPLFKSRAQILLSGAQEGLELLGVVKVWKLRHFADKIIEVALPFVRNFIVNDRNLLDWDGGNEASREAF